MDWLGLIDTVSQQWTLKDLFQVLLGYLCHRVFIDPVTSWTLCCGKGTTLVNEASLSLFSWAVSQKGGR